ncbi:cytidylate kinase [Actinomycetota bacterium]|nr:cytidylate kinase [Actinomycetota bacterium]
MALLCYTVGIEKVLEKVIAIDGPAGVGKSTVAREVAKRLGYSFLDTGSIYRAATQYCQLSDVPFEDEVSIYCAVLQFVHETNDGMGYQSAFSADDTTVEINGFDITKDIRTEELSQKVHYISSNLKARALIIKLQQDLVKQLNEVGVVLEGRDTTDVIAPSAKVKILLTASNEVRAKRRAQELSEDYQTIFDDLNTRDNKDSEVTNFADTTRTDVVVIDTTNLTIDQVVQAIVANC